MKLADREFRQLTGRPVAPVPSGKFKPVKLNAAKFDMDLTRFGTHPRV
ncbi:MAG: hypothetical protein WBE91_01160 [Steroidobacteraceae bacterium]